MIVKSVPASSTVLINRARSKDLEPCLAQRRELFIKNPAVDRWLYCIYFYFLSIKYQAFVRMETYILNGLPYFLCQLLNLFSTQQVADMSCLTYNLDYQKQWMFTLPSVFHVSLNMFSPDPFG